MTINYFLLCYHTKKDFMIPWVCTAIDRRRRQNVARTSPSAAPLVPLFCSYHNLALSVIYCWTDPRHLLIYLWNGVQILCACLIFYLRIRLSFFLTHSCRGWWGWMRLLAREIGTYKCALKDDTESAKQGLSKLVSFINPDTETSEQNRLWAQESVPTNEWHITNQKTASMCVISYLI